MSLPETGVGVQGRQGVVATVRASLGLLPRRDRRRFLAVTGLQMSTALLDLLGVALLGVVVALTTSMQTGQLPPPIVDRVLALLGVDGPPTALLVGTLALIAGVLLISKSLTSAFISRRILRFLANRQAMVSGRLAEQFMRQPLLYITSRTSQSISFALTHGVNAATIIVLGGTATFLSEGALLVILAVGLIFIDPWVTALTIVFFAVVAVALQKSMSVWASQIGLTNARVEVESIELVQDLVRGYREISVLNRRGWYVSRFRQLRQTAAGVQADLSFINAVPKYVFEVALVVGAGVLAASQLLTKDLTAAMATIAVVLVASLRIIPSLMRLQQATLNMRWAAGTAESTFTLAEELAQTSGDRRLIGAAAPRQEAQLREGNDQGFSATVELVNVAFAYPGSNRPTLESIDLSVPEGGSLAIVGPTGSGKSTLVDVILGLLEPSEGVVRVSGREPFMALQSWPGATAYVPQDVTIVSGTVRDNVALGVESSLVDDGRILEALKRARLDEFLVQQRDGLETVVGEHGVRLSGGQRQRLGIARALYSRPRLLILDEATSALDAETERAIIETLEDLSGSVTTVTIAHRLATVVRSDQVAYLENGRVLAVGHFEEVRERVANFDEQARLLGL